MRAASREYGCEAVSEDLVTGTLGLYPQLEQFEAIIPEPNQLLVYEVGEIFTDVAVEYAEGYVMLKCPEEGVYYAMPACDDTRSGSAGQGNPNTSLRKS